MEMNINESNGNWNKSCLSKNKNNYVNFGANVAPIYLSLDNKENPQYKSKCISMILDFSDSQDVGEIFFKNYYTYTISVFVMKSSHNNENKCKKWHLSIEKKVR